MSKPSILPIPPTGDIGGDWYNELGSMVTFTKDGKNLTGCYTTAVGGVPSTTSFDLVGQIDENAPETGRGQVIGWTVLWTDSTTDPAGSLTTWSGQHQIIDGNEEISTLWVLTTAATSEDDWGSHTVNQDVFCRDQPSTEAVAAARKRRAPSYPARLG